MIESCTVTIVRIIAFWNLTQSWYNRLGLLFRKVFFKDGSHKHVELLNILEVCVSYWCGDCVSDLPQNCLDLVKFDLNLVAVDSKLNGGHFFEVVVNGCVPFDGHTMTPRNRWAQPIRCQSENCPLTRHSTLIRGILQEIRGGRGYCCWRSNYIDTAPALK